MPECAPRISNWGEDCICRYLQACERRVLDDDVLAAAYHGQKGHDVGYRKGLDAARAAVERGPTDLRGYLDKTDALAAIDALRDDA